MLVLVVIPLALGGLFLLMQAQFTQSRDLRVSMDEAMAGRDRLARLLIAHVDAETGIRGYVITEQPSFLEPYAAGNRDRRRLFDEIRQDIPPQLLPRLAALQELSDRRWADFRNNIADVDAGRVDAARQRIASGSGKARMDQIRQQIAALDQAEFQTIEGLTVARASARDRIENFITILIVALTLFLLVIAIVTNRSIQLRRAALARSTRLAHRQKAMFDGAVDPMLLLDAHGYILRMNPSVSRLFGYSEEDLIGRHNTALMTDEFTPRQSQAWLDTVGEAGIHGAGRRQEFCGRRKDGTTFDTEVAISRFTSDGDTQYVAAIRDITDRKRAEQMKTEFVSTVSHELRTPLTSIGGSLGLLSAGAVGPLSEKQQRLVTIAHSNCERLIRLINDILDIEKIESGKMEFDLRRMQVAPLLRRTVAAMTGFAEQHRVKLALELPPWPQCVVGDPDKLEQLLTNLVSNAIKHSPEGGEVNIQARQNGGVIRIEVCDRGAGIPIAFRERIFGKFAMADASDSRTKGGTGLGLSIAREIAKRHGGDIGFADRSGGGTVFHVDIPMVAAAPPKVKRIKSREHLPVVLHVDDDLDMLNVVASAFGDRATVLSAASLQQARELMSEERLDAAILDIDMRPEIGLDLIPTLREKALDMRIVLFTALDHTEREAGVDHILVKSRASLDQLVEMTLNGASTSHHEEDS